jgi:hypothetical protein
LKGCSGTIAKSTDGFAFRSIKFMNFSDAADIRREATPMVQALSGMIDTQNCATFG